MVEARCPNCGADLAALLGGPDRSVAQELTSAIVAGADADTAADRLVATLPPNWGHWLRPVVRRAAQTIERDHNRRVEKAVISTNERWEKAHAQLRRKLLDQTFSLRGGKETTWGTATLEQHRERIALLDEQSEGIAATKRRHAVAIGLIESTPGSTCLNDIEGSEKVVFPQDVQEDAGSGAPGRKPAVRRNARRTAPGKPLNAEAA